MTQMMTHFSQCQRNNLLLKNPLNSPHNSVLSTMLLTTDTNNKLDHTASGSNCVLTLWCWHQRANNPTELAPIELLAHCWWQESPKGGSNRSCLGFEWPKTELNVMKWINLTSKRSFGALHVTHYVFGSKQSSWGPGWDTIRFWIRGQLRPPVRHVMFLDQGFCAPWTKRFEQQYPIWAERRRQEVRHWENPKMLLL